MKSVVQTTLKYSVSGAAMLATLMVVSSCTSTSNSSQNGVRSASSSHGRNGEIYLFRGLANVFSLGIDEIGEKMVKKGINAKVFNHTSWRGIAEKLVERNRKRQLNYPIILMGHSLGGNATMQMAKFLGDQGVKVSYAVSFDPTITTFVGPNVGETINYYLPNDKHSNVVKKSHGFTGSLQNINSSTVPGITHVTIEKYEKYQNRVINTTLKLTKRKAVIVDNDNEGAGDR